MLGSANSKDPRLIIPEIIVKVVQPIYGHNTSTSWTDRGQTYGRLLYHDNTALCIQHCAVRTQSRNARSVQRRRRVWRFRRGPGEFVISGCLAPLPPPPPYKDNSHRIFTFCMDPTGQLREGGSGPLDPPGQLRRCISRLLEMTSFVC